MKKCDLPQKNAKTSKDSRDRSRKACDSPGLSITGRVSRQEPSRGQIESAFNGFAMVGRKFVLRFGMGIAHNHAVDGPVFCCDRRGE